MKVTHQMQSRLRELEPLPELLRSSELRLHQMTDELHQLKQIHDNDMKLINDLTAKVIVTLIACRDYLLSSIANCLHHCHWKMFTSNWSILSDRLIQTAACSVQLPLFVDIVILWNASWMTLLKMTEISFDSDCMAVCCCL